MIVPVEFFAATCDNCGKDWQDGEYGWTALNDEHAIRESITDCGWHIGDGVEGEDGKTYCPGCWHYNEDDEFTTSSVQKHLNR